ncbi:DEAD/DEAH box helicase [Kamptonema cortianum]|nr:DEAD/DEAH box helicase [Kamptonema cortianum]
MKNSTAIGGFESLGLPKAVCQYLAKRDIVVPTPIQEQSIPVGLTGSDLIGIAQTGTGKTLAFGLCLLERLLPHQNGLVLAPTRELAHQIAETFTWLGARCVLVVGGESMKRQIAELRGRHDVVVATPGRLIDHLQQKTYKLDRIGVAVLDEADRMLDMGFAPAIRTILGQCPSDRQTLMFSATMEPEVEKLAQDFLRNPSKVEVARAGTSSELVDQQLIFVPFAEKRDILRRLLYEEKGTMLVFSRTRHGARKLAKSIRDEGHSSAEIHSDRTLAQRREALAGFKSGKYRILVATDIAARGIDVKEISMVVNFDVPEQADDYVHRIGRTGRAGSRGKAVTIAIPEQSRLVRAIEKLMDAPIEISEWSTAGYKGGAGAAKRNSARPGKSRFHRGKPASRLIVDPSRN